MQIKGQARSKEGRAIVRDKQKTTENQNKNKITERKTKPTTLTSNSIQAWLTGRTYQRQRIVTPNSTAVVPPLTGELVSPTAGLNGPSTEAPNSLTGQTIPTTPVPPAPAPSPLQVGGGEGQARYDYSGPRWLDGRWRDDKDVEARQQAVSSQ